VVTPWTLVQGAMLGVDRHDLRAWGPPGLLHDRRARDQRLLVGQREPLARLERGHRHRQAGEAHHGVQDDVGPACRGDQALLSGHDLGAGRHTRADLGGQRGVPDHHEVGRELARLGHQEGG